MFLLDVGEGLLRLLSSAGAVAMRAPLVTPRGRAAPAAPGNVRGKERGAAPENVRGGLRGSSPLQRALGKERGMPAGKRRLLRALRERLPSPEGKGLLLRPSERSRMRRAHCLCKREWVLGNGNINST